MKEFKVELKDKFAERQIVAFATNRGWQAKVANPKRNKANEPVVIDNLITAEKFLQNVFLKEFDAALITHESRQASIDAEATRREELEKELGL